MFACVRVDLSGEGEGSVDTERAASYVSRMGTRSSDRPGIDGRPPLAVKSIMDEVEQIGRGRKLKGYRVAFKKNAKGENVVALLWPPQTP